MTLQEAEGSRSMVTEGTRDSSTGPCVSSLSKSLIIRLSNLATTR